MTRTVLAVALAGLAAAVHSGAAQSSCSPNLANELASTGGARQLVTVESTGRRATTGSLRFWRRSGSCWSAAAGPWTARLGRAGISDHHREGDGTTPAGAYGFGRVVYGVAPNPGVRYAYHRLVCGDWWDEDPASAHYNQFRHVPCGTAPPFGGQSEALWRSTRAYRHFAFIRYNVAPAIPGRGSAIFLHTDLGHATTGCVSLPAARLDALLGWLRPVADPLIVIGTRTEIRRF